MPYLTDEQIISLKARERAVKKAWAQFRPAIARSIAIRQSRRNYTTWRIMPIGEIIQPGDMRRTLSGQWILAPKRHIGQPINRANIYRSSRPA